MDLALGIALGSSVQIALCVVPVLCLVGWAMDKPLTLDFHEFETVVLIVSVLVVSAAVREGSATWLEGVMLVTSYLIVAIAYYFRKELPAVDANTLQCVCGEVCCAE
jgi:Ca2+:H+ antiporter